MQTVSQSNALPATSNTDHSSSQNSNGRRRARPRAGARNAAMTNGQHVEEETNHTGSVERTSTNSGNPHPNARTKTRLSARNPALAFRPASVAPVSQGVEHTPGTTTLARQEGAHLGHSGGARSGRHHSTIVSTRQFGGALTTSGSPQTSALQADVPEFKPRQQQDKSQNGAHAPPPANRASHGRQRKRRPSKSLAADLPTRIHEDIDFGNYECAICTSEIVRRSKVWSCHTCWTVFHLECISKWSSNSEAVTSADGSRTESSAWRCPGCNLPQSTRPSSYRCWCEKDYEPRTVTGLPPHSCGQTCGKTRVMPRKCPHPCELLCHAGPCPPCSHMGPTQGCFCGKESSTKRCVDTSYDEGWSCGKICGDVLPCGEHTCQQECHGGLCGACEYRMDARCYCGKEEKPILCCDKDEDVPCTKTHMAEGDDVVVEDWTGMFKCPNVCERPFDCGKHTCQKSCHAAEQGLVHCPRSPDTVTSCPCGKTPLTDITNSDRRTCEDPIPNCSRLCSKLLPCGHECQQTCHIDDCMPCLKKVEIQCRCGRTVSTTICHQGSDEPPQCARVCHATLSCGRHECGERCCAGERKATQRLLTKRKQRPLNAPRMIDDGFEAEHICTRICGRTLKCGNHFCDDLCHRGPCHTCREAIFDELPCHCGKTVLQPPLPCGSKPPPCRHPCRRPKPCGHPQVEHNCHQDDEDCPKCPFLVEKQCLCRKHTLKHQKCWSTEVRCGEICDRKLKCGSHTCRKTCHRPGECEENGGSCVQPCGKPKRLCDHPCEDRCHAPYPCKEDKPCPHKTFITCPCQHLKQEVRCNASHSSPGNSSKSLSCDDECARLARNHKLALALDIDQATHTNDHVPYSTETLSLVQALGQKWTTDQERELRVFASEEDEKRLRFKPMPSQQRAFLHSLAEDFGFDSESMDPEPYRHVVLFKTPRFVSAPDKTLRDCVRIRRGQASAAAQDRMTQQQLSRAQKSNEATAWNGLLLTNVRFALTIDEIETEARAVLGPKSAAKVEFNVQFLPDGNVAFKATQPSTRPSPAGSDIEDADSAAGKSLHDTLVSCKLPLFRAFSAQNFGNLQLARLDSSLNVLRRESDSVAGGGWSQVAAKSAAPRRQAFPSQPEQRTNGFTVLGTLNKKKVAPKVKKEEEVVEDWADAVEEVEPEAPGTNIRHEAQLAREELPSDLDNQETGNADEVKIDRADGDGEPQAVVGFTSEDGATDPGQLSASNAPLDH